MNQRRPKSKMPIRDRACAAMATVLLAVAAPTLSRAQGEAGPETSARAIPQQAGQCKDISTSIRNHAKTIKSLQAENEKDKTMLARSVSGIFRQLTGDPYVSPQTVKNLAKIDIEMRLARDLNSVLASLKCPLEDLEQLTGQKPAPKP